MRDQRQLAKVLALVQHADLDLLLVVVLLQANRYVALLDEVHAVGHITCAHTRAHTNTHTQQLIVRTNQHRACRVPDTYLV